MARQTRLVVLVPTYMIFSICDPLSENTWHIPHFMKTKIRPGTAMSMFNSVVAKNWEQLVTWFLSLSDCNVDTERNFSRKHNVYTLLQ